jgi:NMD protein affecting ribosome stability and mRNA decay
MKKCTKCGREIDEKYDVCYTCMEEQKKNEPKETTDARTASIERQVAAKCAAQLLTGARFVTDEESTKAFNHFLKLIRGQ